MQQITSYHVSVQHTSATTRCFLHEISTSRSCDTNLQYGVNICRWLPLLALDPFLHALLRANKVDLLPSQTLAGVLGLSSSPFFIGADPIISVKTLYCLFVCLYVRFGSSREPCAGGGGGGKRLNVGFFTVSADKIITKTCGLYQKHERRILGYLTISGPNQGVPGGARGCAIIKRKSPCC